MAIRYNSQIVKDNLLFYLDAGNVKSYPGSGTTWYDLSSNGNNFTMQGTLSWDPITGFSGFDGNTSGNGNKFYKSSFPTGLKTSQGGAGLTIMIWTRSNVTGGWRKLIGNADGENYIDLYQGTSTYAWHQDGSGETLYYNGGINVSNDALLINDNVWRLLWATNLNNGLTSNPTYGLTIGNEPNSSPQGTNAYPWIGNIALVAMYSRILTTDEMIQNFNATRRRFGV
jgi:hypothetical protein